MDHIKRQIESTRKQLILQRDTPHFRLFYAMRTPSEGKGMGFAGVDREELIEQYSTALERTYELYTQPDCPWSEPVPDPRFGKIPVYVCELQKLLQTSDPFTFVDGGSTFLGLRSELAEPTRSAVLELAWVEATHEASHAFTHRHRPVNQPSSFRGWGWLDEATAVLAEWKSPPPSPEIHAFSQQFALHWVNSPELPLEFDRAPGGYCAAWFVDYLVKEFGPSLLRDVWHGPRRGETALEALERCLKSRGETLRDANPIVDDIFGARYCVESYCTFAIAERLHDRYGNRGMSHCAHRESQESSRTRIRTRTWTARLQILSLAPCPRLENDRSRSYLR